MNKLYLLLLSLFISLKSFGATDYSYLVFTPIEGTEECSVKANSANEPTGDIVIPSTILKEDGVIYKVTGLDDRAFAECRGITSVVIPDGVKKISNHAFYGCTSLASVTIPDEVEVIDNSAFNGTALKQVDLPANLKTIGEYAFERVLTLESIVIPPNVETIGTSAFVNCKGLKKIVFTGEECPALAGDILCFTKNCVVYVPESAKDAYAQAFTTSHVTFDGIVDFTSADDCTTLVFTPITGEDGACSVKANTDNNPTGDLVIPAEVLIGNQLYKVTAIGDYAFAECRDITSVVIPDGIKIIPDHAFYRCTKLASVTIPDGVEIIDKYAFTSADLVQVELPANLKSIGEHAFDNCYFLNSIILPNSLETIGAHAFDGCVYLTSITIPEGVKAIEDKTFSNCNSLRSVTIPEGVKTIGNYAFYQCGSMSSITIPKSVETIGDAAFEECYALTSITLQDGLKSIGERAFYWCNKLSSITIPNSVETIGDSAFGLCSELISAIISENVINLGDAIFNTCQKLSSVEIPEGVKTIGSSTFSGCLALTSVTLPNSLTSIGVGAFLLSGLKSIVIPENVTQIGKEAFSWKDDLSSVVMMPAVPPVGGENMFDATDKFTGTIYVPNASLAAYQAAEYWSGYTAHITPLETIGDKFTVDGLKYRITSLDPATCEVIGYEGTETELTIPASASYLGTDYSVTAIGDQAFYKCGTLKSIEIPAGVVKIGYDAFRASGLTEVTIPATVTSLGEWAFESCTSLETVVFEDRERITLATGIFQGCTALKSVTLGTGITRIPGETFSNCTGLSSIVIPEGVTSIGGNAFNMGDLSGSLTSVKLPSTLTQIGLKAFLGCPFESIDLPESVKTIEQGAFKNCKNLTSIVIPKAVTEIGSEAFAGCEKLKEVVVKATDVPSGANLMFGDLNEFTGTIYVPAASLDAYMDAEYWSYYMGLITASVKKGDKFTYGGFKYEITSLDPKECRIIGYEGTETELTIPSRVSYAGIAYSVTAIGEKAFYCCTSLTSVTIPGSVTVINSEAFTGCTGMKSVVMEEGVVKIGDDAFYSCRALESVVIPDGITEIGSGAFTNCKSLTSVTIPGTVETIGSYAFQNCESLTSGVIEEGVTAIDYYAFADCTGLKSVVIPKTVTSIGQNAFDNIEETDAEVYIYSSTKFDETIFSEYWVFTLYVVNPEMVDYYKEKYPYLIVYPMLTIQGADSDEPMLVEAGKAAGLNVTLPEGYKPTLLWMVGEEGEGSEELIINSCGEENVVTAKVYDANNPDIYATVKLRGYLAGDSNDNGFVTIDDAVTTANHIVGNTPAKFLEEAADVINPEQTDPMTGRVIDIRDVVATVDIVLAAPAPNVAEPNDIHYAPGLLSDCLNINADGDCLLLTLTGSGSFSALQADVTLPEGAILTDVHAGDRLTSSHSVMYRMIDDRTVRVVVFAMSLDTFMPGTSVVRLQLDAPVPGGVTAANVIASDSEGRGYRLGVNGNGTTGIDGIGGDGNGVNIGAVNGAITVDGAEGAAVEVYGIDGRRIAAFVADGDSVRLDVVPGVYLVRVGTAKAVKIAVR